MIIRRNSSNPDACSNCGEKIGRLETPHLWNQHIVCARCRRKLEESTGALGRDHFEEIVDEVASGASSMVRRTVATPADHFIPYATPVRHTPIIGQQKGSKAAAALACVGGAGCTVAAFASGLSGSAAGAAVFGILAVFLIFFGLASLAGVTTTPSSQIICPNAACGYVGPPRKIPRGSALAGCLLMFFFFLPGLLYMMIFSGHHIVCPRCGLQIRDE
jgi:hypothetical protein